MPDLLVPVLAFLVGAALAWGLLSTRSWARDAHLAGLEARLLEVREQLQLAHKQLDALREQLRQAEQAAAASEARLASLVEARTAVAETFKSVASDALRTMKQDASVDLDARREAIEALLRPLSETLSTYQKETKDLEEKRLRDVSAVGEQLRHLLTANAALQGETAKLGNALRSPQVRGRWGEIALRRTAELSGMSPHCDFFEQTSVTTESGRLRPDMIVRLPGAREVVVDSKVPLIAFLEALEATTDEERETALTRHAAHVNQHVAKLAEKDYWEQFTAAPEFVVMFIPNDSFLAAAAEKDPSLVESALVKRVVIATPTTFIALLRAIAYGWRQETIAESAQRVSQLGQELYERMAVLADHLGRIGASLGRAVDTYNLAVGSFENRVLPSARRFKQLGAAGKKDIEELQPLDQRPRSIMATPSAEERREPEE